MADRVGASFTGCEFGPFESEMLEDHLPTTNFAQANLRKARFADTNVRDAVLRESTADDETVRHLAMQGVPPMLLRDLFVISVDY